VSTSTQEPHTNQEQVPALPTFTADEITEMLVDFLENGKTLADVRGMTPEELETVYAMGFNAYNGGRYEQALTSFQFLVYFDHMEKKYWRALGSTLQMMKRFDKAVDAYGFATLLDSTDPRTPLQAADCHLALGNREEALSGLNAAIEWSGNNPDYQAVKERALALRELLNESSADEDDQGA
jgi:type III secretion system low calcium response chaperone LcrH/SycD